MFSNFYFVDFSYISRSSISKYLLFDNHAYAAEVFDAQNDYVLTFIFFFDWLDNV